MVGKMASKDGEISLSKHEERKRALKKFTYKGVECIKIKKKIFILLFLFFSAKIVGFERKRFV
jgi:hypothetical protein